MSDTVTLPRWLHKAIIKHKNSDTDTIRYIFEEYLKSDNFNSPKFRKLCERLVNQKTMLQPEFLTSLEEDGRFDQDNDDEDALDLGLDAAEEDEDTDDDEEVGEDDEPEADPEPEEEEEEGEEGEEVSQYDTTGVPSLSEVRSYVGDEHEHKMEFESVSHAKLVLDILLELGFSLEYDERLGGTIERRRGGRYVILVSLADRSAVRRRGKTPPLQAFVQAQTDTLDSALELLIDKFVVAATTE